MIPLTEGWKSKETHTETSSVMCTETDTFMDDLITVLKTKFCVVDGF